MAGTMQRIITRADRRRMRRHAVAVAAVMATNAMHRDGDGRLRPITDPTALEVLRRGFAAVLRNDCRPVVHRLTEVEARALPGWRPTPLGATWWGAFGLDVDLRATWVTRWGLARGVMTEAEATDAAEVALLEALAAVCNVPGMPGEVAR